MYTINSSTGVLTPTNPATVYGGAGFGVTVDPADKFAYTTDRINLVWEFSVDAATGVLSQTGQTTVSGGMETTTVAVDPLSKFAYVVDR